MEYFFEALKKATSRIDTIYFQLPVSGEESPIYRERVYCYELYHQLRICLGDIFPFKLCGEIDKSGHRLFRDDEKLNNKKPDFLLHVPGEKNNLVVMEVKPANGSIAGIEKDIETLDSFINKAEYQCGILLIYGRMKEDRLQQIIKRIKETKNTQIGLWIHKEIGKEVVKYI